jgi:hypothetical protein
MPKKTQRNIVICAVCLCNRSIAACLRKGRTVEVDVSTAVSVDLCHVRIELLLHARITSVSLTCVVCIILACIIKMAFSPESF